MRFLPKISMGMNMSIWTRMILLPWTFPLNQITYI